jgi:O-antigen ligase
LTKNMFFELGIIAVLYFAILAWGSNEPWAMAVVSIAGIGFFAARLLWDTWRGKVTLARLWPWIPFLLLIAYVALQLLNPIPTLDPGVRRLPFTISSYSTSLYLLLFVAYLCLALLVAGGFQSRFQIRILILCILGLGVFEALYGLVQYLGDYSFVWDFPVKDSVARGTLINRNHYALLLNMSFCCGVGYLYYQSMRLLKGQDLTFRRIVSAPGFSKLAWTMLWLALIGLALVFSMSRMGIFSLLGCLCVMIVAGNISGRTRRTTVLGFALLCIILGLAAYIGLDAVLARYEVITQSVFFEQDRVPIWQDAWKMAQGHLIFGQGLGTFQWLFPAYERVNPDVPAKYAHNDYLQVLVELGIVGLVLVIWAFASSWRIAYRSLRRSSDPLVRGIGIASIGILAAVALQETTDFSLYVPGIAVMFAILLGLNFRAGILGNNGEERFIGRQTL